MIDVAELAGVSRATVSLVMRGEPVIAPATRDRVMTAATTLGYVYDRRAARLRSHESSLVGLVITDNANLFFAEFAQAIEERLREAGHVMLLGFSHDTLDRQRDVIRRLVEDRVAGLILIPGIGTTRAMLEPVRAAGIRLVTATRPFDVGSSYVGTDDHHGGRLAAEHLLGHGCRRLAFFGGTPESPTRGARSQSFSDAVAAAGATLVSDWHVGSSPSAPDAYELAKTLLLHGDPPDAIACNSDPIAYGVLRALNEAGVAVGTQTRVVGFDDLEYSALWQPTLTSVRVEPKLLGRKAAEAVLGVTTVGTRYVHQPTLALRDSCGTH